MCKPIPLSSGAQAEVLPSSIVVFNFASDDDGKLAQLVSANPGMPVAFLATRFNREVFSQAEGRNRTFVFNSKFVDPADVDPVYPAQFLGEGDMLPALPGNLTVTATDRGFRVDTLPPDPPFSAYFF